MRASAAPGPKPRFFLHSSKRCYGRNRGVRSILARVLRNAFFGFLLLARFPASFVACRVARPRARHLRNSSPLFPSPPVPQASRRRGAELCEAPFGVEGPVLLLFPFRVSIIGSTYGPDTVQIGVTKSGLEELPKFITSQYNFRIKNFSYNVPISTLCDPYVDRKSRNKWERIKTV